MSSRSFSPVILGLWPIAGITTVDTDPIQSQLTLQAALEHGVSTFDTAFSYGYDGESDRLLSTVINTRRSQVQVISKVGQRWNKERQRVVDSSPSTMLADAEASLRRLGTDYVDLMMLHSVDPAVDVRRSAEALVEMQRRGWVRQFGVCTSSIAELARFAEVIMPRAVQLPLNLLQQESLSELIPWCVQHEVEVHVFWVLMKGILAGTIGPNHSFSPGDSRPKYEIYQGELRQKTHRLVERLQVIGAESGLTVAQVSIGWALSQRGVTAALVGAKRPSQIEETASSRPLSVKILSQIDEALAELN